MNKKMKGAIAAGAAALLLAGGAGSFALWNDTEGIGGGNITAGKLQFVDAATTSQWYDGTVAAGNEIDLSTYRIVPGDTLVYEAETTILAEGDNLQATLTVDGTALSSFTGLSWGPTTVTATGIDSATGVITPQSGTRDVTVRKSVTFDAATSGTTSQGAVAALSGVTLKLAQTN